MWRADFRMRTVRAHGGGQALSDMCLRKWAQAPDAWNGSGVRDTSEKAAIALVA
jgi:hypothetical protein